MPYHEIFLDVNHEQLEQKIATLFITLLRVAGTLLCTIGFIIIAITHRGNNYSIWIIIVSTLVALIFLLIITIMIGFYTPWWIIAIMIIMIIVTMFILRSDVPAKNEI